MHLIRQEWIRITNRIILWTERERICISCRRCSFDKIIFVFFSCVGQLIFMLVSFASNRMWVFPNQINDWRDTKKNTMLTLLSLLLLFRFFVNISSYVNRCMECVKKKCVVTSYLTCKCSIVLSGHRHVIYTQLEIILKDACMFFIQLNCLLTLHYVSFNFFSLHHNHLSVCVCMCECVTTWELTYS